MRPSTVIVGGGQAGLETAVALRSKGFKGSVTILSEEHIPPYYRPPLSKALLMGKTSSAELFCRSAEFYAAQDIDLRLNEPVLEIDRGAAAVRTRCGTYSYDFLVLATGSSARTLDVPGSDLDGVQVLRTMKDALSLVGRLRKGSRAVVAGSGFIGMEFAAACRIVGVQVTVVDVQDRPMKRVLSPGVSAYFEKLHRMNGTEFLFEDTIQSIDGAGLVSTVSMSSGRVLAADTVLIAVGVSAEDSLAASAGLPVAGGVVVDEYLRTPDRRIWAIGDCARFPSPYSETDDSVCIESVQNASAQARCVAAQVTGNGFAYRDVPWFWTEQFQCKLQIAGLRGLQDQVVLRNQPDGKGFAAVSFRNGELAAVEAVNAPKDYLAIRQLLELPVSQRPPILPGEVADPLFDLKAQARTRPTAA